MTNSIIARMMPAITAKMETNSPPNGDEGPRKSMPNPTKYSFIIIAVPCGSTPFTKPEKTNVAPATILSRTVSIPDNTVVLFTPSIFIFELYKSKYGIVYHILVIGIHPFGHQRRAVMFFYLFGSVEFGQYYVGI